MPMKRKLLIQAVCFLSFFYLFALLAYYLTSDIYFLLNIMYIGTAVGGGLSLYQIVSKKRKVWMRRAIQFSVGIYMIFFVGYAVPDNIQFDGFVLAMIMLLGGNLLALASAALIHYLIAKSLGVMLISRYWCGWACWFPAIFDFMPFRKSPGRVKKLMIMPYITTALTVIITAGLWFATDFSSIYEDHIVLVFTISLIIYYLMGFILTITLRDNKAICKYFCPTAIIQKVFMPMSIVRINISEEKCVDCKSCEKNCPMDIELTKYRDDHTPILSSECIQCKKCIESCSKDAVTTLISIRKTKKFEYLQFGEDPVLSKKAAVHGHTSGTYD